MQWAASNTQDISSGLAAILSGQMANLNTNGNNVAFATAVSGSGGLSKLGAGLLSLGGNNTYSGPPASPGAAADRHWQERRGPWPARRRSNVRP